MKRRLLAWLLVLCLAVSLLPTAFATETETYATWPTASDGKINLTSGTYRLSDCENKRIDRATVVIPSGATVTLDLAGGTIDNPVDHAIENSGTLNIVGTGGIVVSHAENCAAIVNYPGATATITSGTYQSEKWYTIKNFGVMTFDGNSQIDVATYNGNSSSLIANGWANGSVKSNNDLNVSHTPETADATLTIKNANFHAYGCNDTTAIVKNDDYGVLDIQNGIFDTSNSKTTDATIILNWNKATISGGTFTGNYPISTGSNVNQDNGNACDTKISGGTFTGQTCLFGQSGTGSGGTVTITDGIFYGDFRNGESTNVSTTFSIKGGTFTDIASAIEYADSSSNVYLKLGDNVNTVVTVPEDKDIILDLNGHTLNGETATKQAAITNYGTLTITDTSESKSGVIKREDTKENSLDGKAYYVIHNKGTMTIDTAKVTNNSGAEKTNSAGKMVGSALICNVGTSSAHAKLTINGGTFQQENFIVVKNDDYGELTVNGGTFTSNHSAIQNWYTAEIQDATLAGTLWTSVYNGGTDATTTVNNGVKLTGTILIKRHDENDLVPTLNINGGEYDANWDVGEGASISITGGTFTDTETAEKYLDEGYGLNGNRVQYYVSVTVADNIANGKVQVSKGSGAASGKLNAFVGDVITVTVTPDTGYELDEIVVTNADFDDETRSFTVVTNNNPIEVSATFKLKEYTVTFDSNGGTKVDPQTVKHGEKATEPTAPTKEGYTFAGWYTEAESKWDFNTPVTEALTLIAKWTVKVKVDNNTSIDVNLDETTTGTVSDQVKAEEKEQVQVVAKETTITGLTEAVKPEALADIVNEAVAKANDGKSQNDQTKLENDSDVQVNLTVAVEVTESDLENGTLTFTAEPVATVAVGGETLKDKDGKDVQVPVSNDMLGQEIYVQIQLPAGYTPNQIKHIAKDGTVEYFWRDKSDHPVGAKLFDIRADNCALFVISHFSTFELKGTVEYTINWTYESYGKTVTYATTYVASGKEIVAPAGTPTRIGNNFAGWEGFESGKTATANMTFTANWKAQTYSDLTEPRFCSKAVEWATKNAITNGMDNNCFEPDLECTRSQIVTFLWRAAGCPEPTTTTTTFTDLDNTRFYYKAVLWATEQGIVKGYKDNTFRPDEPCERCEAMCFLYRFAVPDATDGNSSGKNSTFTDLNEDWYMNAVNWATKTGVTKGMDATHFGPEETCTRGHFLTFLWRAVTGSELKDGNSVMETDWANWMSK